MLHDVRSISKSVVALGVLIAHDRGRIKSLDQPVLDYFPELAREHAGSPKAKITIKHALTMTAGLESRADGAFLPSETVALLFRRLLVAPPGAKFAYNGGMTQLLAEIVQRSTGRDIEEYTREQLLLPLGILTSEWAKRQDGEPDADSGLRLRSRDLAKIGLLIRNRGRWGGKQILPAQWVQEAVNAHIDIPQEGEAAAVGDRMGYGYQIWIGSFLDAHRRLLERTETPAQSQLSETGFGHMRAGSEQSINEVLRDDQAQLAVMQHEGTLPEYNGNARISRMNTLIALARLGEIRRAASSLPLLPFTDPAFSGSAKAVAAEVAMEAGRTDRAVALVEQIITAVKLPEGKTPADIRPTVIARYAEMLVAAGRAADAAKAIVPTRGDCYPCLVTRGEVAAAQHDATGATRWFAEAARQGPSLPQADYQWGRMLAANNDRAGALTHFAVAAKRAPGWYEPPFASGRLLMAQNHFADARAALEKAHAAAPKRADVMLALGRAQWLGGDRQAAQTTWAAARKLDLLEPDLAWLKVIDAAVKRAS